MEKKTITVLMVEPHRHPYLKTVEHTLENLQGMVGGYITATYPWEDLVGLVADDDGLSKQEYEWNRVIDEYQIIRGNFFLCGLGEDDFTDIPMDLAEKYAAMFWMPESFVNINGQLMVIWEDDGTAPHV
jgi:hypothetical protein